MKFGGGPFSDASMWLVWSPRSDIQNPNDDPFSGILPCAFSDVAGTCPHTWRSIAQKIMKIMQCEAPKIAFSWFMTSITMVYGTQITIVTGAYKPTYNWGASHCEEIAHSHI